MADFTDSYSVVILNQSCCGRLNLIDAYKLTKKNISIMELAVMESRLYGLKAVYNV